MLKSLAYESLRDPSCNCSHLVIFTLKKRVEMNKCWWACGKSDWPCGFCLLVTTLILLKVTVKILVCLKPGMVINIHLKSCTLETEVDRSLCTWGRPGLYSEFQDSQGYIVRPCFKKEKKIIMSYQSYNMLIFIKTDLFKCLSSWSHVWGILFQSRFADILAFSTRNGCTLVNMLIR